LKSVKYQATEALAISNIAPEHRDASFGASGLYIRQRKNTRQK